MSYDSQTSTSLINKLRKDVDSLTLKVAVLTDSKTSGTSGGAGVATTWTARTLNTIAIDPNGLILQLESNTFKLAAGAYQIRAMAAFRHTGHTRTRIYDVTGSAEAGVDVIIGYSVSSEVSNQANPCIDLNLRVQPHKDNVYRLEYYISAAGADHLGVAAGLTGIPEIYAICEITRLDTGLTKPSGGSGIQGAPGPAGPAGPAGPPGPAGGGTVTDVSVVTANGVSGSVATSTTTPAITLTLGAITPTSVAASGAISAGATVTGSNLSGVNTGDQVIILSGDRMLTEGSDFLITESGDYILETGDVTGQGTGRIPAVITPQAVTYDKMQYVSTANRLLGRATSVGTVEEISLGSGLSFAGTVLSATGTGGTVTNVSVTAADGITASVGTSTTTPAISLGLGAITPTSVASTGTVTGTNLSGTHTGTSSGSNTGDQTITLTGPVTGSGTGSFATTITPQAVTYDKIQFAGAIKRLLGSDGSSTSIGEIILGSNLSMTGNTLSASAPGTGTVTSVNADGSTTGMSFTGGPVITSGTLTLGGTLALTNGGTGATSAVAALTTLGAYPAANPSGFTSNAGTITSADVSGGTTGLTTSGGPITASGTITLAGTLAVTNGGTGAITAPLALASLGAYPANNPNGYTANAGTVTSVGVSGGTTGLTTSGGPITGSGTITLAGTLAIANGGTALTAVGAQYQVLTSTGSAATWTTVDLNNSTSNVLPIAKGGTASITAQSAIDTLAGATTNGQYLRGNGTNVIMSAVQAVDLPQIALGGSAVSGTLGVINGGTGQSNVYTNGDILIGNSTGGTLNRNKIVGTAPITVTNGAGTITIGAGGLGTGDVVGPGSASDGNFVLFDGATGKLIKGSGWNQVGGDLIGSLGSSSMIDGFVYIPADTAAPTGTPTNVGAPPVNVPMFLQTNNAANTNVLWVHNGYAWKYVTLA